MSFLLFGLSCKRLHSSSAREDAALSGLQPTSLSVNLLVLHSIVSVGFALSVPPSSTSIF